MDAKLQRRVQRYGWDKAASHYERSWQSQLEPAQSVLLELAGLKPGIEVLDVACGTGLVALKAAALIVPGGRIVGTDISEQMILAAQDIVASRGIANAHFERMLLAGTHTAIVAKCHDITRQHHGADRRPTARGIAPSRRCPSSRGFCAPLRGFGCAMAALGPTICRRPARLQERIGAHL